jgi:hypothetical protein
VILTGVLCAGYGFPIIFHSELALRFIDVFNGDADGLCALHQLRLSEPRDACLVTGPKREIDLLARVDARAGDRITVLDIALSKNRQALDAALAAGASVRYFDHHQPGEIPVHPGFEPYIDTDPATCTSLLVDRYLQGAQRAWAVVAAFGDNMGASACRAAVSLGYAGEQLDALRELGECLNYNGYGETLADLHFSPESLYRAMQPFADPFAFMDAAPEFARLRAGFSDDLARVTDLQPVRESARIAVYLLPAEPWSRRISGVLANRLAESAPGRAHAVLTRKPAGGCVVSLRAPLNHPDMADAVCSRFAGGGGRKGAAGINHLPTDEIDLFMQVLEQTYV